MIKTLVGLILENALLSFENYMPKLKIISVSTPVQYFEVNKKIIFIEHSTYMLSQTVLLLLCMHSIEENLSL